RRVTCGDGGLLKVKDTVNLSGAHEYELFWNLGPECCVTSIGENRVEIVAGGTKVVVTFESSLPVTVDKGQGWYSRRFGEKQPIDRIEIRAKGGNWSCSTQVEVDS
ncbi:MAG: heparinase II/III family protein, partial [Fimbriimonadales bacterium]